MKKSHWIICLLAAGVAAYTQRHRLAALLPGGDDGVPIASLKAPPHVINTLRFGVEAANTEARTLVFHFELANCGPCERLDNEVFTTRPWKEYAAKNAKVIDYFFPNQFTDQDVQVVKNMELMKAICQAEHVSGGFPMVAVISSDGRILGAQEGYRGGGSGSFISWLEGLRKKDPNRPTTPHPLAAAKPAASPPANPPTPAVATRDEPPAPAPGGPSATPPAASPNAPSPPEPVKTATPESFLRVKGILAGTHPLAMIQSGAATETVEVGESATLSTPSGAVTFKCARISRDTVVLLIGEGKEQKEVTLH